MAASPSNDRNSVGSNGNAMKSSESPTHFFKIILSSTLKDQKLRHSWTLDSQKIPKKFVKKFGNELSAIATITIPSGRTWKLGLQKAEGGILFVDGWQEFVEYHSIDFGYFLVFRYEGFSKFHVCIFDKTATEIDYPSNGLSRADVEPNFDKQGSEDHEEEAADDDDYEILEHQRVGNKRKKLCIRATSLKCKVARSGKNCKFEGQADQVGTGAENISMGGKVKENEIDCPQDLPSTDEDEPMFFSRFFFRPKTKPMTKESERAMHAARNCKRKHPSFLVLLSKYNMKNYYADVPAEFATKYMQPGSGFIKVEAFNGKKWRLKCRTLHGTASVKRISQGWAAFKNDNNLKEGDVCVFELIKQKGTLLRASVYHAADYADPVKKPLKKEI